MYRSLLLSLLLPLPALSDTELIWSDEFNTPGAPDPDIWGYDLGDGTMYGIPAGWGNGELQTYTSDPANVNVEDGNLRITAQRNGDSFTSARVTSEGKLAFQYGTIMARIQNPSIIEGLWPAFWTMGNGGGTWPSRGELDIMELGWKGYSNRRIYSAAHWEHDNALAIHDHFIDTKYDLNGTYHIYRMVWNKTYMATYVDYDMIWDFDISPEKCTDCEEFHRPHSIRLNVAVGGGFTTNNTECGGSSHASSSSGGSHGGCSFRTAQDITADLPADMLVDWVRIYSNDDTILIAPTDSPTSDPTANPTANPTAEPTANPTGLPPPPIGQDATRTPTTRPTALPTDGPTGSPVAAPAGLVEPPIGGASTRSPTPAPTVARTTPPVGGLQATASPTRAQQTMPPIAMGKPVGGYSESHSSSGKGKGGKGSSKSSKSGKSGKGGKSGSKSSKSGKGKGGKGKKSSSDSDESNIFDNQEGSFSSFTNAEQYSSAASLQAKVVLAALAVMAVFF